MRRRSLSGFLIVPAAVAPMAVMAAPLDADAESRSASRDPRANVLTVLDPFLRQVSRNHRSEEIACQLC